MSIYCYRLAHDTTSCDIMYRRMNIQNILLNLFLSCCSVAINSAWYLSTKLKEKSTQLEGIFGFSSYKILQEDHTQRNVKINTRDL